MKTAIALFVAVCVSFGLGALYGHSLGDTSYGDQKVEIVRLEKREKELEQQVCDQRRYHRLDRLQSEEWLKSQENEILRLKAKLHDLMEAKEKK